MQRISLGRPSGTGKTPPDQGWMDWVVRSFGTISRATDVDDFGEYFRASKSGTQTIVSASTETKITFNTLGISNSRHYDATNSKWKPPYGLNRLSTMIAWGDTNITDGTALYIVFYKNGSSFVQGELVRLGGAAGGYLYSSMIDLSSGTDYYEIYGLATVANSVILTSSFWEGHAL